MIAISRQPLLNQENEQAAYLLTWQGINSGEDQSAKSLLQAVQSMELDNFLDGAPAYLMMPNDCLDPKILSQLPREYFTLVFDAQLFHDEAAHIQLSELAKTGCPLAFTNIKDELGSGDALLGQAAALFLNLESDDEQNQSSVLSAAHQYTDQLIGLGVFNYEQFNQYKDELDLLGGHFYMCPQSNTRGQKIPSNRMVLVQLMSELYADDVDTHSISKLLTQDVKLGYQLLKVINSALYNLPREIESLHEAVVLIGIKQIRDWSNMILISNLKDKPSELLKITMRRSKMAELLAEIYAPKKAETYSTIGLFSTLDAMLNKPMSEVLTYLPFSDEVKKALLSVEGEYGDLMRCIYAYENGNFNYCRETDFKLEDVATCYLDAMMWTHYTNNLLFSSN